MRCHIVAIAAAEPRTLAPFRSAPSRIYTQCARCHWGAACPSN